MHVNVQLMGGDSPRTSMLKSRLSWSMVRLVEAAPRGLRSIEWPAATLSGHHARYRLACAASLTILGKEGRP